MHRLSALALVFAITACTPPTTTPEGEVGCEAGEIVVEAEGFAEGDTLALSDDGSGQLEATIDVRIDGVDTDDTIASVGVTILGDPRPPADAAPGDDGQTCVVQGAAYTCDAFLRCIDNICRVVVADRSISPVEPVCGDDNALHLEGIVLPITELIDAADLAGASVELRVAVERDGQSFETGTVALVLSVE